MIEEKLDGKSLDITSENIQKLKELFPEVVTEDKIDFDKLKLILGKNIDESHERYNFTWTGKREAINESNNVTTGTLRPYPHESKNWNTTENLYIEGDNLEVLRLLQGSYNNKIKMIYIDPPYNTGNDFIYLDDYSDNIKNYLKITGQLSDTNEKYKISTNTETNGRFHSNWLNMMYPRLKLARNLLTDDGIIFISIDDKEVENLRKICDEIFGENNFLAQIIVEGTPKNDPNIISTAHEYCLVYTKNFNIAKDSNYGIKNPLYSNINKIFEKNKPDYKKIENELESFYKKNNLKKKNISNYKFADKNGIFRLGPIDDPQNSGPKDERINPLTNAPCLTPNRGWSCKLTTWNEWLKKDLICFSETNEKLPSKKTYIKKDRLDVLKANFKIQTRKDTNDLKELFELKMTPFPNPKPKELIKKFIENCNDKNMIVLDFFSGSATTAEVVFNLNEEDQGKRKFILVQFPEEISIEKKSGKSKKITQSAINFLESHKLKKNICEIGKERIRRAGDKILEESDNKDLDIGFKVFKLDSSNLEKWDPDYNNIEQTLLTAKNNIKENRTEEDLVYEIMLKYGLDLTLPIEKIDNLYSIGYGALIICLDNNIDKNIVDKILEVKGDSEITRVVFKDNGFKTDSDKTNIKETLKANNIEEFITI